MAFFKKLLYLIGAAAVVVIAIRLQDRHNAALQESGEPVSLTPPPSLTPQPPRPLPQAPQLAARAVEAVQNLATNDPLKKRKLDMPLPKSKRDLLSNLSDFKSPMLPGLNTEDADVKAVFRGFYEAEPGKYRRIELNRAQAIYLSIEDVNQRFPIYQEAKGDFDVSNFHDDPYSIVMTLRDMRMLYLKFHTGRKIPDYSDPNFRVMSGWIMDGKGARQARRVAMIDGRKPELADTRESGQYLWPRLEVIQMLMPSSELGD